MLPALSSVASPPASSLLADAVSPAGVLPAVAFPAALVPFERPFLQPPAPATPHPVASCAARAELQVFLVPATSDVPVAAPSTAGYSRSAAPLAPAVSVLPVASVGSSVSSAMPGASDVPAAAPSLAAIVAPAAPAVPNAVAVVSATVREVCAAPSATTNINAVPAMVKAAVPEDTAASVPPVTSAVPVDVAVVPPPAPSSSSGRGVKVVVSRGEAVAHRGVVHANKKVGKATAPYQLRRPARAALAAGVVKPAPFCFPVVGAAAAAASSVSCVGSWLLASARTVKVARKPARRIVSVRRLLRPAVRKEIMEQKAAIVVRRRVTAARRRAVAARLAVFARRAA
ncbi:hypothetical protein, partial, partial [Parasitella parasitica]